MANQSLQLRLSQKLSLAPQLQQAIRLLQLNRIELRDYIQEAVDSNPILEREDGTGVEENPTKDQDSSESDEFQESSEPEHSNSDDYDWQSETRGDTWTEQSSYSGDYLEPQIEDQSTGSLREHLLWQINLGQFSEDDAAIATGIVFGLDDDGFLEDSLDDIRGSLAPEHYFNEDEIRAVLHRIQRMEPVGVASRDPAECIPSFLSMVCHSRSLFSDEVQMSDVSDHWVRKTAYMLDKALSYRQEGAHMKNFTDLIYEDLVSDPFGQLKKIYDRGEGVSQSLEERFLIAERENPKGKYGVHHYSIADFGLSKEDLIQKNAHYYKLYNSLNRRKRKEA